MGSEVNSPGAESVRESGIPTISERDHRLRAVSSTIKQERRASRRAVVGIPPIE